VVAFVLEPSERQQRGRRGGNHKSHFHRQEQSETALVEDSCAHRHGFDGPPSAADRRREHIGGFDDAEQSHPDQAKARLHILIVPAKQTMVEGFLVPVIGTKRRRPLGISVRHHDRLSLCERQIEGEASPEAGLGSLESELDRADFAFFTFHSAVSTMTLSTLKRPSAFIPLAMSFAALALVLGHIAFFGTAREADEGAAAHLWQLLMAGQTPVIAFFAIRWLPRTPTQASIVLGLQALAGLAAAAPVYILQL